MGQWPDDRRWLPASAATAEDPGFRARTTVRFALLGSVVFPVFALLDWLDGSALLAAWDVANGVAMAGILRHLRKGTLSIPRGGVAVCTTAFLDMVVTVYAQGGGPDMFAWLALPGLLAVFLHGRRVGALFMVLAFLAMVSFTALTVGGHAYPHQPAPWFRFITVAAIPPVLWVLASSYETAQTAAQATLEKLRNEAEQASLAKSRFLANMSHEIRTPMNGVIGMIDLLRGTELTAEQAHTVDVIQRSGHALLQVIDDILDFSKVEAGKVVVEAVPVDLRALVTELVDLLSPLATPRGVHLTAAVAPDVPTLLRADPLRLRQVLHNVVGNALKFTERGEVAITADVPALDRLRVTVRDTGVGIEPTRLSALFTSFTQADASTTRRFGGTGLGLAISRGLMQAMGGSIRADSVLGRGSTFTLELPLIAEPAPPLPATRLPATRASPAPHAAPAAMHVLVAEDNVVNQQVVRAMLRKTGHTCEVVPDGRRAVEAVERRPFDLVLMDCHMPELDGRDATRAIRALPSPAAQTPVVALTASALEEDRRACFDSGMDDVLTKPLTLAALARVLAFAADARAARAIPPPAPPVVSHAPA